MENKEEEKTLSLFEKRKVGRFRISSRIFRERTDELSIIFSDFIPCRAEAMLDMDSIEYTGYCKHFEEVPEGVIPPEYVPIYSNVTKIVMWKKRDFNDPMVAALFPEGKK